MIIRHFKWKSVHWISVPILATIHTSMILILPCFLIFHQFRKAGSPSTRKDVWLALTLGLGLAVALASFLPMFMLSVEDRRASIIVENVSLAYVAFWFLFCVALSTMAKQRRGYSGDYFFSIFVTIFVPALVALSFPGFRFLVLTYPIIVGSCSELVGLRKFSMLGFLGIYQGLLYIYRVPLLDWNSIVHFW